MYSTFSEIIEKVIALVIIEINFKNYYWKVEISFRIGIYKNWNDWVNFLFLLKYLSSICGLKKSAYTSITSYDGK